MKRGDIREYKGGPGMYLLLEHEPDGAADTWRCVVLEADNEDSLEIERPGEISSLGTYWLSKCTRAVA